MPHQPRLWTIESRLYRDGVTVIMYDRATDDASDYAQSDANSFKNDELPSLTVLKERSANTKLERANTDTSIWSAEGCPPD